MGTFTGKVALVTGGGTGIGKSIAEGLVAQGGKVVITGRREEPLRALAQRYPDQIAFVTSDATKAGDPKKAVEFTIEKFGSLDVLFNNAGAFLLKPLVETTDEEIAQQLGINVAGVFSYSREAIPYLSKTKGSIINISSVIGTAVMAGTSIYSSTKAAVDHATRVLAAELGPAGIRVNVVAPGMTRTDMAAPMLGQEGFENNIAQQTPLGRFGEVQDISRVALFLASDDAGWVTGQIIAASGGLML